MRHLAAYLLLQIGGNASPSAADIKKVLGAVGIEADEDRLEKLISELESKDVIALVAEGSSKRLVLTCFRTYIDCKLVKMTLILPQVVLGEGASSRRRSRANPCCEA